MPCPRCECPLAYVFYKEDDVSPKSSELCDLETGAMMRQMGADGSSLPSETYRTAECAQCHHRFRLGDDEYERVRW